MRLLTLDNTEPLSFPGRDEGGMIPDPRLSVSLNVIEVIRSFIHDHRDDIVREDVEFDVIAFDLWWSQDCSDDSLSRQFFPPRSKGDLAIRRTRFLDLRLSNKIEKELVQQFIGIDYIRSLCSLWYLAAFPEALEVAQLLTIRDINVFDDLTSKLSNKLKATQVDGEWELFAELKCLTGYRLLPWPGFDVAEDAKLLASGGETHNMYQGFDDWLRQATSNATTRDTPWITLKEYIESGDWVTAGASSAGSLTLEFLDETYHVKCRKNFVLDVLTYDELTKIAEDPTDDSVVFVKNELGKLRLAVVSDLGSYLLMSWFARVSGYSYKSWKWTTRNETGDGKLERMRQTLANISSGSYGMAWDYKGFERQVNLSEITSTVDVLYDRASSVLTQSQLKVLNEVRLRINWGLMHSTITDKSNEQVLKVTGGLPSGLFLTSIMGDAIGLAVAQAAITLASKLGVRPPEEVTIQGDDASYLSPNPAALQIIDWIIETMGFHASTGKFGIVYQQTEFLRVAYTKRGCRGYIARAIPGIVQRKPWSDAPMTEYETIENTLEAATTCGRRGMRDWQNVADKLLRIWTRKNNFSYVRARTPIACGGLGLLEPILDTRFASVTTRLPRVTFPRMTTNRSDAIIKLASEISYPITTVEATDLANKQLTNIAIGDNVRGFSAAVRKLWKRRIAEPVKRRKLVPLHTHTNFSESTSGYASYSKALNKLQRYAEFDIPKHELVQKLVPELNKAIAKLGHISYNEAFDWLTGSLPVYLAELNPLGTRIIAEATAQRVEIGNVPKGRLIDIWNRVNLYTLGTEQIKQHLPVLLW